MGKLIKQSCSLCGKKFVSRTRSAAIRKMGKHWRKEHPLALSRRIKGGKSSAADNPSVQDFISALGEGTRSALEVYSEYTEKQYQDTKKVMDAVEPVLSPELRAAWKTIEAVHDHFKK